MEKTCSQCQASLPLEDFYNHPFGKEGRQNKCKECTKAYVKANRAARIEYYRTYDRMRANNTERVMARKSYAKKNKRPRPEPDLEKRHARVKVGNAIRDGKLIPALECDVCKAPSEVQGHHDDYSKPLSVLWLCTLCHGLIHSYWNALDRKGL